MIRFLLKWYKKRLHNAAKCYGGALGAWAKKMPWQTVGVEPTWRAEQVSVEGFIKMADALSEASSQTELMTG